MKKYKKPKVMATNSPKGSYAADCDIRTGDASFKAAECRCDR